MFNYILLAKIKVTPYTYYFNACSKLQMLYSMAWHSPQQIIVGYVCVFGVSVHVCRLVVSVNMLSKLHSMKCLNNNLNNWHLNCLLSAVDRSHASYLTPHVSLPSTPYTHTYIPNNVESQICIALRWLHLLLIKQQYSSNQD